MHFWGGFRDFLKNYSYDFDETLLNGRGDQYEAFPENRTSKACSVLEIFIHKVQILAENGQSEVQRLLYISRTVNATENLIRYSESTENFLSRPSHQILAYSSSSWWKFDPKTTNWGLFWMVFGHFLGNRSKDFDQTQKTAGHNFEPFWRYLGSK